MLQLCRLFALLVVTSVTSCAEKPKQPPQRNIDLSIVKTGDILFRRGQSLSSKIVLKADSNGNYSHIGMAVNVDGVIMVTHAIPGERDEELIRIDNITDFYNHAVALQGAICRYPLDSIQRNTVNQRAIEIVANKTLFDNSYNTESQEELYCTEFVWEVFKSIGTDLSLSKRTHLNLGFISTKVILPSHIYNNEQVNLIKSF